METLTAKLRNKLTSYCNLIALHRNSLDIPEYLWEQADKDFKDILELIKTEENNSKSFSNKAEVIPSNGEEYPPNNKREVPTNERYKEFFSEKQIEHIKTSLALYKPQKNFIEDIKYPSIDGYPKDYKACIVYTDIHRDDICGSNYGHYEAARGWLFEPVRNGRFVESEPLSNKVIGYIEL